MIPSRKECPRGDHGKLANSMPKGGLLTRSCMICGFEETPSRPKRMGDDSDGYYPRPRVSKRQRTARKKAIAALADRGYTNTEIAETLPDYSIHTIRQVAAIARRRPTDVI